jgi:hypothetical protein
MKDYLAQVEKFRSDAAECALIRDLATDPAKREMFDPPHGPLRTRLNWQCSNERPPQSRDGGLFLL